VGVARGRQPLRRIHTLAGCDGGLGVEGGVVGGRCDGQKVDEEDPDKYHKKTSQSFMTFNPSSRSSSPP
jgi:hypothetical protein